MSLVTLLRYARRHAAPAPPLVPLPDSPVARLSMLNMDFLWPEILPVPDGTIDAADRLLLSNEYVRGS